MNQEIELAVLIEEKKQTEAKIKDLMAQKKNKRKFAKIEKESSSDELIELIYWEKTLDRLIQKKESNIKNQTSPFTLSEDEKIEVLYDVLFPNLKGKKLKEEEKENFLLAIDCMGAPSLLKNKIKEKVYPSS